MVILMIKYRITEDNRAGLRTAKRITDAKKADW
jgi:hypothetical protein